MSSGYQDKMQCHLERLWSNVLCPNFQIQLWNSSSLESFNIGCRDFRIEKFLHRNFLQDGKLWLWFKMKGFDLKASYWLKILCFHPILKQQEYPYYGQHRSFITIMHEIFFLCHFLLLLMFFSLSFSVFNQNVCIEFFYPFIHMMARRKLQCTLILSTNPSLPRFTILHKIIFFFCFWCWFFFVLFCFKSKCIFDIIIILLSIYW